MIETILREFLASRLGVPVLFEAVSKETSYVLLERTGGGLRNFLPSATFAAQAYGASLYDAADLSRRVREAMIALPERDCVAGVRFGGEYNFTDPQTKKYRYQSVWHVYYYE